MRSKYLLIFILLPQLMFAQTYKSLFTVGKVSNWNIFSNTVPGLSSNFKITNDTIVNGIKWKFLGKGTSNTGLLREDTISGKVWFKGINPFQFLLTDTAEKLVCDFSLNLGDSFHYYYHQPYSTKFFDGNYWLKVDSVFYLNGLKHIRFDTSGCRDLILFKGNSMTNELVKFVMVEGFGSNRGFHYMFNILNHWVVQCQYRDSDLFYMNSFSSYPNNCNLSFGDGINEIDVNHKDYIIYPNPTSEKLLIKFLKDPIHDYMITIFNNHGQEVGHYIMKDVREFEINVSNLASGLYALEVTNGYSKSYSKIIIN